MKSTSNETDLGVAGWSPMGAKPARGNAVSEAFTQLTPEVLAPALADFLTGAAAVAAGQRGTASGGAMGRVKVNITMSLDGFVAGPNQNEKDPLGIGGMRPAAHSRLGTAGQSNLRELGSGRALLSPCKGRTRDVGTWKAR